jgi:hypothetical protein
VRRILLNEMQSMDGDFALIAPGVAERTRCVSDKDTRLGIDKELRNVASLEPAPATLNNLGDVFRLTSIGCLRGRTSVGNLDSRVANGAR